MATFTSAYTVGDPAYILTDIGTGVYTAVTNIEFRAGTNFGSFVPATDFIYTLNALAADSITHLKRAQGLTFASKTTLKAYIDTLPDPPAP